MRRLLPFVIILIVSCQDDLVPENQHTEFILDDVGYDAVDALEMLDGVMILAHDNYAGYGRPAFIKVRNGNVVEFIKSYGLDNEYYDVRSFCHTSGSGIMVVGEKHTQNNNNKNIYLLKADSDGDTLWSRQYDFYPLEAGLTVNISCSSGFIVGVQPWGESADNFDFHILNINDLGELQWDARIGTAADEYITDVIRDKDCGYFITGFTTDQTTYSHLFVSKTDADGNEVWSREFNEDVDSGAMYSAQTEDRGYVSMCTIYNVQKGVSEITLIKMNSSGSTEWTKSLESSYESMPKAILAVNNEIVVVSNQQMSPEQTGIFILHLDGKGNEKTKSEVSKKGLQYNVRSVTSTLDKLLIVGNLSEGSGGKSHLFLIRYHLI